MPKPKKIAFLFLIYDIINHEDLWKEFFLQDRDNRDKRHAESLTRPEAQALPKRHNIYIHYKSNVPLKHFEKHKLDKCVETAWATVSLVIAQNLMIKAALQDPDNEMFILCSGACVPFKTFNHVINFLNTDYSYFNVSSDEQCFPRCNNALKYIDKNIVKKHHQWCILNRKHATILTDTDVYIKWFEDTIGDEHCYLTYLNYKGLFAETIRTPDLAENATTFTNWPSLNYPFKNTDPNQMHTLKNYESISSSELLYLFNSKCLFGRKFLKNCNLSLLSSLLSAEVKKDIEKNFIENRSNRIALMEERKRLESNRRHIDARYERKIERDRIEKNPKSVENHRTESIKRTLEMKKLEEEYKIEAHRKALDRKKIEDEKKIEDAKRIDNERRLSELKRTEDAKKINEIRKMIEIKKIEDAKSMHEIRKTLNTVVFPAKEQKTISNNVITSQPTKPIYWSNAINKKPTYNRVVLLK